ncbi:hypothetical protein Tco_0463867, partial [Tanacetum coccineum]
SNVPDNSLEQGAATEHSIPRRLDSPTSQAILIPELQDCLAPAENKISILQIRAEDAENRRVEDHEQIQKILAP